MKKIFTVLGFLFSISAFTQNADEVADALKSNDVNKFTSYFSSTLDFVTLPKHSVMQNVKKAEAADIIEKFFAANNINGFEVILQREMSGTTSIAGKFKSTSLNYNITVMLKNKGDSKDEIISVRIN